VSAGQINSAGWIRSAARGRTDVGGRRIDGIEEVFEQRLKETLSPLREWQIDCSS
jgi:hypothetical protein